MLFVFWIHYNTTVSQLQRNPVSFWLTGGIKIFTILEVSPAGFSPVVDNSVDNVDNYGYRLQPKREKTGILLYGEL
jgi:hypothetical protein